VHGEQKLLSNTGFHMANCIILGRPKFLTKCHGVPCTLPSRITTKVLKTARLFPQDRDQDKMFIDQDQDFHFCPRGASRPRPCQVSRTIHHWCNYMHTSLGCLLEANACMHYATPTTKNNTISPRVFGITHYVLCRIHEVISRSRKGAQPQAIHFRCYNFITWLTLCCP